MSGVGGSKFQELMRQQRATSEEPTDDGDRFSPDDYQRPADGRSFTLGHARRQPGFSIAMVAAKIRYWIGYHSIRRLKSFELMGREYIEFTHENLAVTIEGKRLDLMIHLIGEGRIKAIFEPQTENALRDDQSAQITAIRVTDVEDGKADSSLKLVK